MVSLDRRQFIRLGAAATAATTAALAGCLGGDERPTYADWVPTTDDGVVTAYLDMGISTDSSEIDPFLPLFLPSRDGSESADVAPVLSGLDAIEDPLLTMPFDVGGKLLSTATLGLSVAGLGYLVDPSQPTRGVTELSLANGTVVGTGDIDVATADERLREGTEGPRFGTRYEEVDERGSYAIYEPADRDADAAVAVGESAVLVADARSGVERTIATRRGNHDRAVDGNDEFDWLVDTAGKGHVQVGWSGGIDLGDYTLGDPQEGGEYRFATQRDHALSSVRFVPDEGEITADFALRASDLESGARDRLAARLGAAGEDKSLSVDGNRVSTSATYTDDVLDIDFVQRTPAEETGTDRTTAPDPGTPPPAVEAVVSEDAFAFSYNESENRVRVDFVEDFDADRVTVRAIQSGSSRSSSTPGPISYMTVYVQPDGDTVVVTVTVDGTTGEVVRREFP